MDHDYEREYLLCQKPKITIKDPKITKRETPKKISPIKKISKPGNTPIRRKQIINETRGNIPLVFLLPTLA